MTFGIVAWGGYVPRNRLDRSVIAATHAWMAPSLKGQAKGRRAFCNWDEDVVTMSVEAARNCLGPRDRSVVGNIQLASTTAPTADLQSSAIVAVALRLGRKVNSMDVGGSHRAGMAVLSNALRAGGKPTLVLASERLRAKPASVQEMQYGAGAAAFLLGSENVAAALIGSASVTTLLVDHFRASGFAHDYFWEERWIREEGYLKIGAEAIREALADAGVAPDDVTSFVFPAPSRGIADAVAKAAGIAPTAVAGALELDVGFTGAAHSLLMLSDILDKAQPGQLIVVAGFGQGADVVVLRTTDAVASGRPARPLADLVAAGHTTQSYAQMAAFYDEIHPDQGMRAERDTKTALTEQYRSSDQVNGFVAGQCSSCGQVQFPQLAYCVECQAPSTALEPLCLAEEKAHVLTFTADGLTFHPSPPMYMGFAQFDVGARLLMEFVDVNPDAFDVGTALEMRFRIKERDETRGYYRYFWKAAPVA
ncbi:3-oxoacyl-[acyl-carrier-protein] synthase III C-terminal domain-containing protein [Sphingobium sp. EM0848]|uniref:3-oxoacyl-[acyl-carrier-protein] synthase III C-terminal domain-containing protein n=1 Tax=Sphingobium sp. EM0848 TaxID=2743473 RepID=UPI00159C4525|nr:3-oxoacyl-[acyl-carrier-protein] synthase III C-terminal domain-containing protein [Sphingobium sp. EM0848]